MKGITLLLGILIFMSCVNNEARKKDVGYLATHCRKCTPDQMKMVQDYFNICKETSYMLSHCLNRAIVMHCDTIKINP